MELERPREELLDLLPYVDVAFISKDFAQNRGYSDTSETLKNISKDAKSGYGCDRQRYLWITRMLLTRHQFYVFPFQSNSNLCLGR